MWKTILKQGKNRDPGNFCVLSCMAMAKIELLGTDTPNTKKRKEKKKAKKDQP